MAYKNLNCFILFASASEVLWRVNAYSVILLAIFFYHIISPEIFCFKSPEIMNIVLISNLNKFTRSYNG